MPIEIKELHIRINVDEKKSISSDVTSFNRKEANKMVKSQVEQVMHIESRKKER